ncbi:hypothetical protein MRX96_027381 [Rhipicephalus microplus]
MRTKIPALERDTTPGAIGCLFAESYALYKRKRGAFPSKTTRQHGREWAVRDREKRIIPRPIRGDSERRHSSLDGRRRQCSRSLARGCARCRCGEGERELARNIPRTTSNAKDLIPAPLG